jgi:hypothetical protein
MEDIAMAEGNVFFGQEGYSNKCVFVILVILLSSL